MSSIARSAVLLVVAALSPLVAGEAAAQVPATEAAPFIADWDLALEGDTPMTIRVNITDADGQVAAVVTGAEGSETPVETITKSDENLVLSYTANIQGQEAPIEITLTPDGENLSASLDFAGMATIPGTATKRQ